MTTKKKKLHATHKRILALAGFIGASAVAIIYYFVVPEEASSVNGSLNTVLSYGHSASWALLAVASLLWGFSRWDTAARWFAYAALLCYVAFFGVLLLSAFK